MTFIVHEPYTTLLKDIKPGIQFMMLNYKGLYIRVEAGEDYQTLVKGRMSNPLPLNDDGCHVPIVELATGHLSWMSKIKPCLL